jgi:hypothetical protein
MLYVESACSHIREIIPRYSGLLQDTSCAAGFLRTSFPAVGGKVCAEGPEGKHYWTCCIPNDPASAALEVAVVVLLVTNVWAEVAQQFRILRRVEYENLGQFIKEALSQYTHDIWNVLNTAALFAATVAGVARARLFDGVGSLSPANTADLHMYAIILGFLRFMTILQVFEFSGSQFVFTSQSLGRLFMIL